MTKQLTPPNFINPFFMKNLPTQGIVENGRAISGDNSLGFLEQPYPDGTEIMIYLGRYFYCRSLEEIEAERVEQEKLCQNRQHQREKEWQDRVRAAQEFNERLNIPVPWKPEIKHVLSGLSESSWGDGRRRNTVVHVYLLDNLSDSRIERQAGDFLCSKNRGKFADLIDWQDSNDTYKVTCKKCLEIAKRWQRSD